MDLESKSRAMAEDRISGLPDAVLSHILACLGPESTKCAVRTSILSKRWKNIWASVPNLYFNDRDFSSSADFIAFVDRALQIRGSLAIQKFDVCFTRFLTEAFSHIGDWMSTAVRCHVEELDLSVNTDGCRNRLNPKCLKVLKLPKSLVTCKTLVVLKLGLNFIINIPTSECFPSLKILHVTFDHPIIVYPSYDSIDFSYCPVLEHLTIDGSLGDDGFNFNITLSELKTLRIRLSPGLLRDVYNFLINAPKLEKLDVKEGYLSNYTFENTKSLVEANIKVFYEPIEQDASANRATKLLAGISSVKYLRLSSPFSKGCSVAAFDNLRELTLLLHIIYSEWSTLTKILERSSNLECLVLEHAYLPTACLGEPCLRIHPAVPNEFPYVQHWSPPESVPKCLPSHLKTIRIKGFKRKGFIGYLDAKEVINYLLKNGQVLEKMTIYTPVLSGDEEEELNAGFSKFEWGSKACQVEIIEKVFYRSE